jgi:hypothetical protein
MKRLTLNFLVVMLLFSWIGVEVAVRNQIVSGTDIETYNSLYQKALDCPNKKMALHHTYSRYLLNQFCFQSAAAQKKEAELAYMVEFYIAYERYIQKRSTQINTSSSWKASIINFYLLSAREKDLLYDYLKALDKRPPVNRIY